MRVSLATLLTLTVTIVSPSSSANDRASQIRSATDLVAAKAAAATFEIRGDRRRIAFATVVEPGWLVTKASVLDSSARISLPTGRSEFEVVKEFDNYDLALIRVDSATEPCEWVDSNTSDSRVRPGQLALCVGRGRPVGLGVIGVGSRRIGREPGLLGVFLDQSDDVDEVGVGIREVQRRSAASRAGLRDRDVVLTIGEKEVRSPSDVIAVIRRAGAGGRLRVEYRRGEERRSTSVVLDSREEDPEDLKMSGGALSSRRSGFGLAFQHDAGLRATHCGGPVVDAEGRVIGINIARAGRVRTYAIPAAAVRRLVDPVIAARQ